MPTDDVHDFAGNSLPSHFELEHPEFFQSTKGMFSSERLEGYHPDPDSPPKVRVRFSIERRPDGTRRIEFRPSLEKAREIAQSQGIPYATTLLPEGKHSCLKAQGERGMVFQDENALLRWAEIPLLYYVSIVH